MDPLAPITDQRNDALPAAGLPAGDSLLLVNGQPAPVSVEPNKGTDPTGLVIDAPALQPPLRMTLEGRDEVSDPLGLTSQQVLILETQPVNRMRAKDAAPRRTQPVALATGRGFKPNSSVKIYLLPDTEIGTLTTDSQGNYNGRIPVPAGLKPGVYTLQSNGLAPDNTVRSMSRGVLVKQARVAVTVRTVKNSVYFDKLTADLTPAGKAALTKLVKTTGRNSVSVPTLVKRPTRVAAPGVEGSRTKVRPWALRSPT